MKVHAELRCYYCGYTAAQVEGTLGQPLSRARLISPIAGPGVQRQPDRSLRCGRCGGPLFLDEVEKVRYRPAPVKIELEPAPHGRPRRVALAS